MQLEAAVVAPKPDPGTHGKLLVTLVLSILLRTTTVWLGLLILMPSLGVSWLMALVLILTVQHLLPLSPGTIVTATNNIHRAHNPPVTVNSETRMDNEEFMRRAKSGFVS